MPSTYEPIATTTLGSDTATVTFSSIPSTYTDLVIVTDFSVDTAGTYDHYLQFNSDTGSNYSHTVLYGTGSAAGSARQSAQTAIYAGTWNSAIGTSDREIVTIQINNYSNATTYKTTLARWNSATVESGTGVGLWRNTAAITTIFFKGYASTKYKAGSTFTLYGIKAA
jgi:hypothetical protein